MNNRAWIPSFFLSILVSGRCLSSKELCSKSLKRKSPFWLCIILRCWLKINSMFIFIRCFKKCERTRWRISRKNTLTLILKSFHNRILTLYFRSAWGGFDLTIWKSHNLKISRLMWLIYSTNPSQKPDQIYQPPSKNKETLKMSNFSRFKGY